VRRAILAFYETSRPDHLVAGNPPRLDEDRLVRSAGPRGPLEWTKGSKTVITRPAPHWQPARPVRASEAMQRATLCGYERPIYQNLPASGPQFEARKTPNPRHAGHSFSVRVGGIGSS
jgi:hypothetical protein